MNTIENLHNSIDFNNLSYHDKGPTANVSFNNFIDGATLFGATLDGATLYLI